jgi:hypothetical protein
MYFKKHNHDHQILYTLFIYSLFFIYALVPCITKAQETRVRQLNTSKAIQLNTSKAIQSSVLLDKALHLECIQNLQGIFAIRDLSIFKRFLQILKDHAPQTERLDFAFQTLYEHQLSSLKLWQSRSQGIDIKRGIFYLWNREGKARLAIAYRANQIHIALKEAQYLVSNFFNLQYAHQDSVPHLWEAMEELPSRTMQCRVSSKGKWILCDEANIQTASAPKSLTIDKVQGSIWSYIVQPELLHSWLISTQSAFSLSIDIQGEELSIHTEIVEDFNPLYNIFTDIQDHKISNVMHWVDPVTPAFLKLSIQPELLQLYPLQVAKHTWLKRFYQWYKNGWNGDLLLTFDGSLDHPILLIGTQTHPWANEKLLTYWSNYLGLSQKSENIDSAYSQWRIPYGENFLYLPVGVQSEVIMVGLFPADIKRRLQENFKSEHIPLFDNYERKGISGVFFDPSVFNLTDARIKTDVLHTIMSEVLTGQASNLVDLPMLSKQSSHSLANTLVHRSQLNLIWVKHFLHTYINDPKVLVAMADLMSLWIQISEGIKVNMSAYIQTQTHLALDVRWSPL